MRASRRPKPELSAKAYVDGRLYRPTVNAVRDYYARPDVLREILGAMALWHVRLEPGQGAKHRWFNVDRIEEIRDALMRSLDRMVRRPGLLKFPYLRIDARRYDPAASWNAEHLWGYDFIIEKDGHGRRECWDPMMPVMRILDSYGVHYWLKYTGHHSLHVVVPAENFPLRWGKLRLADYMPSFAWRLNAFFSRLCFQCLNEGGGWGGFGGGSVGTNMPYSVNEDSGLLNYPVRETELSDFDPEDASVVNAKLRSFWRRFPDKKRGIAKGLVAEVLRPFQEQTRTYRGVPSRPPQSLSDVLKEASASSHAQRARAMAKLPWFAEADAADAVLRGLKDRRREVRKASVRAMVGIDDVRCERALHEALRGANPSISSWIRRVLTYRADIGKLREGCQVDGQSLPGRERRAQPCGS